MGSSPAFTPSARPSIMASPLTQAIMLLIAFAVFPAPTGPTWKMFGPMARSTGWARFKGSASPPTMIASVAARAPLTPPLTGASRKCTPRSFARGSIFFGVEGSTLLRSMRIVPGLARSTNPPGSRYTASTSGEAGSEVSTISELSTTSRAEPAFRAPASSRFSMALGFVSKTVIGNDAFTTFSAMGLPMFPTPMNPTEFAISRLLLSISERSRSATSQHGLGDAVELGAHLGFGLHGAGPHDDPGRAGVVQATDEVAVRVLREAVERRPRFAEFLRRDAVGQPAVRPADDPLEHVLRAPAK